MESGPTINTLYSFSDLQRDIHLSCSQKEILPLTSDEIRRARKIAKKAYNEKKNFEEFINDQGIKLQLYITQKNIFAVDLSQKIGVGSKGTVYIAHHISLDTPMITKLKIAHSRDHRSDFIYELKNLQQLHEIIDCIEHQQIIYLFSQYTSGIRLSDILYPTPANPWKKRALDHKLTYCIILACIQALTKLHTENNLLHRDINTDNIIISITETGIITATFIDYGAACCWWEADQNFLGVEGQHAPERVQKDKLNFDFQDDFFALAIMGCQIITNINYPFVRNYRLKNNREPITYQDYQIFFPEILGSEGPSIDLLQYAPIVNFIIICMHKNKCYRPDYRLFKKLSQSIFTTLQEMNQEVISLEEENDVAHSVISHIPPLRLSQNPRESNIDIFSPRSASRSPTTSDNRSPRHLFTRISSSLSAPLLRSSSLGSIPERGREEIEGDDNTPKKKKKYKKR